MKAFNYLALLCMLVFALACKNERRYVDLNTGKQIVVEQDPESGYMLNTETKKPVYLYVNAATNDTIYGRTGKVVNRQVIKRRKGDLNFVYDGDEEYVYRDGDYKKKVDDDGAVKIENGDSKIKYDSDGDVKVKDGDYKKKTESDGDVKIKNGDTKIKIEDGKRKVKKDD